MSQLRWDRKESPWHDTSQVCLNGHMINSASVESPQFNQKHCSDCGAATITSCEKCSKGIRGMYHSPRIMSLSEEKPPAFCHECGQAYQWTEEAMNSIREIADLDENLTQADKKKLNDSIADLTRDTPRTPVAAVRFTSVLKKAGQVSSEAIRKLLVDIASETAKKLILRNG